MKIAKTLLAVVVTVTLMACAGLARAEDSLSFRWDDAGKQNVLRVYPDQPCKDALIAQHIEKWRAGLPKSVVVNPALRASSVIAGKFEQACVLISPYNGRMIFIDRAGKPYMFQGTLRSFVLESLPDV